MNESLHLAPKQTHSGTISLPGSKSISNRTLLLSALSNSTCRIKRLLDSDDTRRMREALSLLGVSMIEHAVDEITVQGCGGRFPADYAQLFLGNAGTAFRPLTAVLALMNGSYQLSGVARMHERPIGDLVDALRQVGANIKYLQNDGYPPLQIEAFQDNSQRTLSVRGDVSSQFLSALLMALPLTKQAYTINVEGELISKPYIDITLNLIKRFGITIENHNYRSFSLPENSVYTAPATFNVEGDASGASYFFAMGLLGNAPITVEGVDNRSIQGDIAFVEIMEQLGAKIEWGNCCVTISPPDSRKIPVFDIDANHIPDAAMTLAIVALAADGTSSIRNIASWRVKETDRIDAMTCELRKLGATVENGEDYIRITPPEQLNADIAIDTYDDHRMAMCFSLVSLLGVPVIINDPKCVNKTFPDYFSLFSSLTN
ncbi:MAG: 3-phosphoshikimate 1-carboxyvinyltransferase [Neisseriaceae bacterium]|nr:3-phosphoshikimate 1-carboxyvinyltransferase [Neisseriaceae bacterium]